MHPQVVFNPRFIVNGYLFSLSIDSISHSISFTSPPFLHPFIPHIPHIPSFFPLLSFTGQACYLHEPSGRVQLEYPPWDPPLALVPGAVAAGRYNAQQLRHQQQQLQQQQLQQQKLARRGSGPTLPLPSNNITTTTRPGQYQSLILILLTHPLIPSIFVLISFLIPSRKTLYPLNSPPQFTPSTHPLNLSSLSPLIYRTSPLC